MFDSDLSTLKDKMYRIVDDTSFYYLSEGQCVEVMQVCDEHKNQSTWMKIEFDYYSLTGGKIMLMWFKLEQLESIDYNQSLEDFNYDL